MDVSVVIPAFNAGPFLARTLQSVDQQTCRPVEIIVVDDGSSDDTSSIAADFTLADGTHPRVIRHESSLGVAAARNHGAFAAKGAWVALTDSDDLWHPDRLGSVARTAAANANASAVATGCTGFALESDRARLSGHPRAAMVSHWVDDDAASVLAALVPQGSQSSASDVTTTDLQNDIAFATTTVVYERRAWAIAGGCATWSHLADDYMLNLAVSTLGPIVVDPAVLTFYRVRPTSLSHDELAIAVPYLAANVAARYGTRSVDERPAGELYRHLLRRASEDPQRLTARQALGFALLGGESARGSVAVLRRVIKSRTPSR